MCTYQGRHPIESAEFWHENLHKNRFESPFDDSKSEVINGKVTPKCPPAK